MVGTPTDTCRIQSSITTCLQLAHVVTPTRVSEIETAEHLSSSWKGATTNHITHTKKWLLHQVEQKMRLNI